jgi:hypothetical protein
MTFSAKFRKNKQTEVRKEGPITDAGFAGIEEISRLTTYINFPAGREAILSQFRVWPFLSTIIMTSGERNRNPGHHFAGISIITSRLIIVFNPNWLCLFLQLFL